MNTSQRTHAAKYLTPLLVPLVVLGFASCGSDDTAAAAQPTLDTADAVSVGEHVIEGARRGATATTEVPTTEAPTTEGTTAPTTPITEAPTTTAPTTAEVPVTEAPATTAAPTTEVPTTATPTTEVPIIETPTETVSQKNARRKAESYLDYSAFSESGLVEQLEFEGFSPADAAYGVVAQHADWNEQAAKKAASYLDYSSFSLSGLVEQLEFEGFTPLQARYGASTTGL